MSNKQNPDDAPKPDPFDPDALRLSPNFRDGGGGVRKLLTTVPVRKPHKQEFIRVHPSPLYRRDFGLLTLEEDRETYLVAPHLQNALALEFYPAQLYTAITRQGVVFLWPVKIPRPDGREITWHKSAREAAERAMSKWVRVVPNQDLGAYDLYEAVDAIPAPEWQEGVSYRDLLEIAFRSKFIDTEDHPVIRRLRGARL